MSRVLAQSPISKTQSKSVAVAGAADDVADAGKRKRPRNSVG